MELLNINNKDIEWLKQFQPLLKISEDRDSISGLLIFRAFYDEITKELAIVNLDLSKFPDFYIEDLYQVEINFNHEKLTRLPMVKEVGNKIKGMVGMKGISSIGDLHLNKDETACLCVAVDEDKYIINFTLEKLINKLIIPFFYAQSYYKKYEKWPWNNYGHGIFGILERYIEEVNGDKATIDKYFLYLRRQPEYPRLLPLIKQKKHINPRVPCICKSKKKFLVCHKNIVACIEKFRYDLKSLNYPRKKLY